MTARLAGCLVGISVQLVEQNAIDLEVVSRPKVLEKLMDVMLGGGIVSQHPAIGIVLLETLPVGRARNFRGTHPDLEWSGKGIVPILHINVMPAAVAEESNGLEAGLLLEIFYALDGTIVAQTKDEQSVVSGRHAAEGLAKLELEDEAAIVEDDVLADAYVNKGGCILGVDVSI